MSSHRRPDATPVRLVRIISRLNIGGPAIQAITLTERLTPLGYDTTLIRGSEAADEGNMDYLADELGVRPVRIASLERNPGPNDLVALGALVRALRARQPRIVHSHAAKAGTLGRLAALLAFRPSRRPVLVHTFHGHSLSGYFSSRRNAIFLQIERFLARRTDRLIAVSEEVRDELAELGVAPRERFAVVPLGFDLSAFLVADPARAERRSALRAELGLPGGRARGHPGRAARADQAGGSLPARRRAAARRPGRAVRHRGGRRAARPAARVGRGAGFGLRGWSGRGSAATCPTSTSRPTSWRRPPTTRARRSR